MASNLRRSKRTIGRRLSYVEAKLNVARRVNVPRRLGPGAVNAPALAPDVNSTIQGIQTTADGKNTIYRQSSAPTGGTYAEGDLWFDTSQNNRLNRYVSGSWVAFTLGDNALASISANKITAGTIDASVINVSNLNAGNIVTGILSSIEMRSGTPVGGLYPFSVGTDGSFRATNATLSGTITSTSGKIGAFSIGTDALTAATFAVLPFDTASSMAIGSQGEIFGRVDVGSFWGTPFYTETIVNASDGSGIIVRGNASGGYLETRIRASFISTNQLFLPGGSVQTQLNGKASSTHNHDGTYSSTSHTHSFLPLSGGTLTGLLNGTSIDMTGNIRCAGRFYGGNADNYVYFGQKTNTETACFRVNENFTLYERQVARATDDRPLWINPEGTIFTGPNFSSLRYKNSVTSADIDVDKFMQVDVVNFYYNDDVWDTEVHPEKTLQTGIIVEQLDELGLTELVTYDSEGRPDGLRESILPFYLLQTCRSQQKKIEELYEKLSALEGNI